MHCLPVRFLFTRLVFDPVWDGGPHPPVCQSGRSDPGSGGLSLPEPAVPLHRRADVRPQPLHGEIRQHPRVLGHALLPAHQIPQLPGKTVVLFVTVCHVSVVTDATPLSVLGALQREGGVFQKHGLCRHRRWKADAELLGDERHGAVHPAAGVLRPSWRGDHRAGGRLRLDGRQRQLSQWTPGEKTGLIFQGLNHKKFKMFCSLFGLITVWSNQRWGGIYFSLFTDFYRTLSCMKPLSYISLWYFCQVGVSFQQQNFKPKGDVDLDIRTNQDGLVALSAVDSTLFPLRPNYRDPISMVTV